MSVSISTSSIADLGDIGWKSTFALLRAGHNPANKRGFLNALNTQALVLINAAYTIVPLAITNDEYAGVSELVAGEATLSVGDLLRIVGSTTEDLTDDALATAKGGAVAAADLFLISGADAVTYQGNGTGVAVQAGLDAAYALSTPEASAAAFVTLSTHI